MDTALELRLKAIKTSESFSWICPPEEDVSLSKSPAIADCALAQLRLLLHCLLQALQYEVAIVRCFVIGATQFPEWCQQAVAQVECLETHAMGVTCLSNIRRISSKGQLLVMAVNILLSLHCWHQCIEWPLTLHRLPASVFCMVMTAVKNSVFCLGKQLEFKCYHLWRVTRVECETNVKKIIFLENRKWTEGKL